MRRSNPFSATSPAYRDVGPSAVATLDGARIIDVREPDEFAGPLGHIPGAELVPLATVQSASKAWHRDETILLVCRSGGRSGRAAKLLAKAGFSELLNLKGGMELYSSSGLPVEH
jgi:rhodanese-related sulfurtransferase